MSDGVGGLVDGVGDEDMQSALVGGLNAEGQVRRRVWRCCTPSSLDVRKWRFFLKLKCAFLLNLNQANLERLSAMLRVSSEAEEAEADGNEEGMFDDAD